jgi:hypothetical protein
MIRLMNVEANDSANGKECVFLSMEGKALRGYKSHVKLKYFHIVTFIEQNFPEKK